MGLWCGVASLSWWFAVAHHAIKTLHIVVCLYWLLPVPHWDLCAVQERQQQFGEGGTWFGVSSRGLRQKLGGLRVRQAALRCGIPPSTLRFIIVDEGFPPLHQRLLCVQDFIYIYLLLLSFIFLSCQSTFHFISNTNECSPMCSFDFRFESWLCHLVVVVQTWNFTECRQGGAFVCLRSMMFVSFSVFSNAIIKHCVN